jgi:hypothetical protein
MHWSKIALFFSGSFCCGAIDHGIASLAGRTITPYGIHVGVLGNWGLFAFDTAMMVLLLWLHRRLAAKQAGA